MEILNNIWMAISTPNEGLVNIIVSLATFIENFLIMTLFLSILNIKSNSKQKILYVIIMSFISIISLNMLSSPLNIFFNYLITIILACELFRISILKSLLSNITAIVILALVSTLVLNPYLSTFNIDSTQLNTIPIYRLGYLIIMYLTIFILSLIIKNRKIHIELLEDIDKKTKIIIMLNLLLGIFTLFIQFMKKKVFTIKK